ncbi:bifunctional metallophosphatase/5'-nucleotidase [Rathayibacter toxicus]|nr:bifunctional metallophosphatase/5'-nucleotidase [Rathayibacter toxicus]QWL33616.1 bifunctional metallophosphatase/5'-nucleotidase [Rathayibacter toxicus]QWL35751.1 bifunctional metallophosphatase/5'-nucleotidase [Rathayibacter toxicus]QWL37840.1 bifunctional metallophosphatase/5'-nucleotidase [Rathayibacter toxicus]QWL39930.1 bifunctional metallophosphatase/5'-nucleotidase [Rathayibacter toxicus]
MRSPAPQRSGLSRVFSAAAVAAVAGAALLASVPAVAAEKTVIDVYTMNDFHGRLEATAGPSIAQSTAGAASLASAFATLKEHNPEHSILVSAGDNVGASTFTSAAQDDLPTIDALNEIGLSATAIGNHEFDKGRKDLDERIIPHANYRHISANLLEKKTHGHAYAPSYVQDFDGVRVGFVGAVTEDLPSLTSPAGIATLDVAPIVESVTAEAARLHDGVDERTDASVPENQKNLEADVVIVVVHEGAISPDVSFTDPASVFGRIVNGVGSRVDAVVSGHTHQAYNKTVTVGGKTLPVVQTGSYGTYLGHLELTVDPATRRLTAITSDLVDLLKPVQANDSKGVVSTSYQPIYPADSTSVGRKVAALVKDAVSFARVRGAVPVGTVTADIRRASQSSGQENRGAESTLGNLVADAQLWATRDLGTRIAFSNPGSIRDDITFASSSDDDPPGTVTYREAAVVQPFANSLVVETLTGAQVRTLLEEQWQPGTSRPQLHLGISSGLSYTYDPAAAGPHITGIYLDGEPIGDAQNLRVVTNAFLSAGGDNFTVLHAGTDKADSGRRDLTAVTDYLAAFSPVSPNPASRSIGITTTSSAGSATLSYELSSLDVNNSPVHDDEVRMLIDDQQVATVPIDHSIVDNTDEQGRARVIASLGDLTPGDHKLEFLLPTTGVSVHSTVTVAENNGANPALRTIPLVITTTPTMAVGGAADKLAATGIDATPTFLAGGVALVLGAGMAAAGLLRRVGSK